MSVAWVLCIILDRTNPAPAIVCTPMPSQSACHAALVDWVDRATAWEVRSRTHNEAFAICGPASWAHP